MNTDNYLVTETKISGIAYYIASFNIVTLNGNTFTNTNGEIYYYDDIKIQNNYFNG